MIDKVENNRLGKFWIHWSVFPTWQDALPIMGNFVPVHAQHRWDLRAVEIIAYSPLFDPVPENVAAPEYELEISFFPHAPVVIKAHRKQP
jgi:hypothetical protein